MTGRDPYAEVGRATRESMERALAADLTGRDWKVLVAIWHRLATWSRLSDGIYASELCTLSGLRPNKVRESVAKLVEAGVIWRDPSRGRHASTYGLPTPSAGSIEPTPGAGSIGSEPTPDTGSIERPTLPADGVETLPADGVPAEESAEEKAAAAAAAFAQLVADVGLSGRVRLEMYEVWKSERARAEACVNEWSKRRAKRADIGPGLLVRMVRDGDDPGANGHRPRRTPSPPCPHCEVGGGEHAADCPTLEKATA